MRKLMALFLAGAVLVTGVGCTGSFILTKKVYNFHRSQEGKWMDELVFLGCVILPVYGLATLGDAIIFNSIEFWTEENPLNEAKVVTEGDQKIVMTSREGVLEIASAGQQFQLEKTDAGVVARDASGQVIYRSVTDDQGGVTVYNGQDQLVRHFSADEVSAAKM